jgi:hypothetical protein
VTLGEAMEGSDARAYGPKVFIACRVTLGETAAEPFQKPAID